MNSIIISQQNPCISPAFPPVGRKQKNGDKTLRNIYILPHFHSQSKFFISTFQPIAFRKKQKYNLNKLRQTKAC